MESSVDANFRPSSTQSISGFPDYTRCCARRRKVVAEYIRRKGKARIDDGVSKDMQILTKKIRVILANYMPFIELSGREPGDVADTPETSNPSRQVLAEVLDTLIDAVRFGSAGDLLKCVIDEHDPGKKFHMAAPSKLSTVCAMLVLRKIATLKECPFAALVSSALDSLTVSIFSPVCNRDPQPSIFTRRPYFELYMSTTNATGSSGDEDMALGTVSAPIPTEKSRARKENDEKREDKWMRALDHMNSLEPQLRRAVLVGLASTKSGLEDITTALLASPTLKDAVDLPTTFSRIEDDRLFHLDETSLKARFHQRMAKRVHRGESLGNILFSVITSFDDKSLFKFLGSLDHTVVMALFPLMADKMPSAPEEETETDPKRLRDSLANDTDTLFKLMTMLFEDDTLFGKLHSSLPKFVFQLFRHVGDCDTTQLLDAIRVAGKDGALIPRLTANLVRELPKDQLVDLAPELTESLANAGLLTTTGTYEEMVEETSVPQSGRDHRPLKCAESSAEGEGVKSTILQVSQQNEQSLISCKNELENGANVGEILKQSMLSDTALDLAKKRRICARMLQSKGRRFLTIMRLRKALQANDREATDQEEEDDVEQGRWKKSSEVVVVSRVENRTERTCDNEELGPAVSVEAQQMPSQIPSKKVFVSKKKKTVEASSERERMGTDKSTSKPTPPAAKFNFRLDVSPEADVNSRTENAAPSMRELSHAQENVTPQNNFSLTPTCAAPPIHAQEDEYVVKDHNIDILDDYSAKTEQPQRPRAPTKPTIQKRLRRNSIGARPDIVPHGGLNSLGGRRHSLRAPLGTTANSVEHSPPQSESQLIENSDEVVLTTKSSANCSCCPKCGHDRREELPQLSIGISHTPSVTASSTQTDYTSANLEKSLLEPSQEEAETQKVTVTKTQCDEPSRQDMLPVESTKTHLVDERSEKKDEDDQSLMTMTTGAISLGSDEPLSLEATLIRISQIIADKAAADDTGRSRPLKGFVSNWHLMQFGVMTTAKREEFRLESRLNMFIRSNAARRRQKSQRLPQEGGHSSAVTDVAHRRLRLFTDMLGLSEDQAHLHSPIIHEQVMLTLHRLFGGEARAIFDSLLPAHLRAADQATQDSSSGSATNDLVSLPRVLGAISGGFDLQRPRTWDSPYLLVIATENQLLRLVSSLRRIQRQNSQFLRLDDVLDVLVQFCFECAEIVYTELRDRYEKLETASSLTWTRFTSLLKNFGSVHHLELDELVQLFKDIQQRTSDDDKDNKNRNEQHRQIELCRGLVNSATLAQHLWACRIFRPRTVRESTSLPEPTVVPMTNQPASKTNPPRPDSQRRRSTTDNKFRGRKSLRGTGMSPGEESEKPFETRVSETPSQYSTSSSSTAARKKRRRDMPLLPSLRTPLLSPKKAPPHIARVVPKSGKEQQRVGVSHLQLELAM